LLDHLGDDPKGLATATYEKAGSAQMLAVDGLTQGHQAVEGRGAHAPGLPRPCADRLPDAPHDAHGGDGLPRWRARKRSKAEGKHLLSAQGSDKLSLRNLFKEGDYEKSLTGILKDAGVHEDDIPTIIRKLSDTDGGVADLAGEMSNTMLARARATGEWGYVEGTNAAWAPAYVRAVNRQIRNSARSP
jgi:hypothetical protein